jgi:hypothetical protein
LTRWLPSELLPCFLVNEKLGIPLTGKGKRWILNLRNSDNALVAFMDAHCMK